ncbi:MAG: helix-turn-helix domain-containing protein [Firmicutes bacterium]|nr:helix-turn-helix domain-containing protein [[Eubacterium] siraeum]MCM1487742.1 helix-turn-helix domain-containing protein [Bacillota bacterium]
MDRSELGRRIREARLAKKMTQTEAAGDFITRNMLSQIESGSANPSLKTLEYLAGVLEIPVSSLIPDENEEEPRVELSSNILVESKNLYNAGEYQRAAERIMPLLETDLWDEASAITAKCYMNLAQKKEKEGKLSEAAELAYKAYDMSDKGVYASRDIKTISALLMNRIAEKVGK